MYEISKEKGGIMKDPSILIDVLYNLSNECIRLNGSRKEDIRYAKGALVGVLSTVIALKDLKSTKEALDFIKPYMPRSINNEALGVFKSQYYGEDSSND